jgi:hypothetical protein
MHSLSSCLVVREKFATTATLLLLPVFSRTFWFLIQLGNEGGELQSSNSRLDELEVVVVPERQEVVKFLARCITISRLTWSTVRRLYSVAERC